MRSKRAAPAQDVADGWIKVTYEEPQDFGLDRRVVFEVSQEEPIAETDAVMFLGGQPESERPESEQLGDEPVVSTTRLLFTERNLFYGAGELAGTWSSTVAVCDANVVRAAMRWPAAAHSCLVALCGSMPKLF